MNSNDFEDFSALLHYHYSVLYLSKQNLETVLKEIKQDTHSHVAGIIFLYYFLLQSQSGRISKFNT